MAIIGKLINENSGTISIREGEVLADIITNKEYFQIRTYAMDDFDRKNGSKQNIQLTKEKAIELRKHLDKFIGQSL